MKFRSSYIWAALVALGAAGWMASGMLGGDSGAPEATTAQQTTGSAANSVANSVATSVATSPANNAAATAGMPIISSVTVENSKVRRSVRASGVTRPKAIITLSAEIGGTAVKVPAVEGRQIEAGDVLVVIDTSTLPARIEAAKAEIAAATTALDSATAQSRGTYIEQRAAAEANLEVAKQRLEIAQKLAKQNFSAPVELAQLKANYENARMTLAQIDLAKNLRSDVDIAQNRARLATAKSNLAVLRDQLAKSTIKAPVAGWLETMHLEQGEQIAAGSPAATILDMGELKIVVAVPQTNIGEVELDDQVNVNVAGAGMRKGAVTKIASISSTTTRTFDVEVTVPNPGRELRAGMTVEANIDVGFQPAFGMSPAHLSVAGDGSLTAKIDDGGTVRVVPVELVRSGVEQVFVSGLADGAALLTFGQAFVNAGDPVRVSPEPTS
ncbi:MAG: HlyD family efflux transporter periplasmic adaptor subunit [Alphaproteobacteria bacterium]|nr:HlyD family efflux transporter periplasmic adaptor subunit [Alphaproteobacteria bacterium]